MDQAIVELGGLRTLAVGSEPDAPLVVALLHGYAMAPSDLAPFAHSMGVPGWFLFPEGPLEAIPAGRAWWPIDPVRRAEALRQGPRDLAEQQPSGLPAARERLEQFLAALAPLVRGRPLILGGFSQGGMLTCDAVLRGVAAPSGLVLLSASRIARAEWVPLVERRPLAALPALVSHGRADTDLAFGAGERLRDCLLEAGAQVTWVPFAGGHEIPLPVWRALRKFLLARQKA